MIYWAKERYVTLNQIKKENTGIEKKYSKAFKEAYARTDYYKVRYLMHNKDYSEARTTMKNIAFNSNIYFLLYIITFVPLIWNWIHYSKIKRKLSLKLLGC